MHTESTVTSGISMRRTSGNRPASKPHHSGTQPPGPQYIPKYILVGHESFVFRHGWLKKGVDGVHKDPAVFQRDEALIQLGVGKNMVRSIRHWCLATSLVAPSASDPRKLEATHLGIALFQETGYDPFLEDTGTLWLLHWLLCTNETRGLIWRLIFERYYEPEFTKRQITDFVQRQLDRQGIKNTSGSIEREVDCFLRTYVQSGRSKGASSAEESFDCPLTELGLILHDARDNIYHLTSGPRPSLPAAIFAYCLLEFFQHNPRGSRTIAIDELLFHPGSPGQLFRIDENSLMHYLEPIPELTDGYLDLIESLGMRQLRLPTDLSELSTRKFALLHNYYATR